MQVSVAQSGADCSHIACGPIARLSRKMQPYPALVNGHKEAFSTRAAPKLSYTQGSAHVVAGGGLLVDAQPLTRHDTSLVAITQPRALFHCQGT